MKLTVTMTNGKKIRRVGNFTSVKQDINIDRLVWKFYCNNSQIPSHEIPHEVLSSFLFTKEKDKKKVT